MEPKNQINWKPLELFFKDVTSPEELAATLEELMFDYTLLIIHTIKEGGNYLIHEDSDTFICQLKILKDTLRECIK